MPKFENGKKNILLIGGLGLVGQLLHKRLLEAGKYNIRVIDRNKPSAEIENFIQADITNYEAVRNAMKGMEVVVHLAAAMEDSSVEAIHTCNILGTENVFKACQEAGVKRIIFASSVTVMHGYKDVQPYSSIHEGEFKSVPENMPFLNESTEPFPPEKSTPPDNFSEYVHSKLLGEQLAKQYSSKYGISCLCIRLGWINSNDSPLVNPAAKKPRPAVNWISKRDAVQIFKLGIEAEGVTFGIYYGVSNYKYRYLSLENAKEDLGYKPQDNIDQFCRVSTNLLRYSFFATAIITAAVICFKIANKDSNSQLSSLPKPRL